MRGPFKIQRVSGLPAWTAQDEGRVIYDYVTQLMYFADGNEWKAGGAYADIPQNTILLIESDTAITGFSLLTNKDDMVVYITKGSVAGGAAAGTDQGTQTFASHQHTQFTHQHTGPSHRHTGASHLHGVTVTTGDGSQDQYYNASGVATNMTQIGWSGIKIRMDSGVAIHMNFSMYTSIASGLTGFDGTGLSGNGGGENTGPLVVSPSWNTWKPRGRNFTRQQRT